MIFFQERLNSSFWALILFMIDKLKLKFAIQGCWNLPTSGGTLLPSEVKMAVKDMKFLIFQKWFKTIPVVFWQYIMMHLGQFMFSTLWTLSLQLFFCKNYTTFYQLPQYCNKIFFLGLVLWLVKSGQVGTNTKSNLWNVQSYFCPFQLLLSAFFVSRDR